MARYDFFNYNEFYEPEELGFKLDSEALEMKVLGYREVTDDPQYNEIANDRMDAICNYCIDKIIELHNGKDIIVNDDGVFINAVYANYYSDVIERAYDIDAKVLGEFINNYYNKEVKEDRNVRKSKSK